MGIDYSLKSPTFNDPIVSCSSCQKLVHRLTIASEAGCNNCGHRRFQSVRIIKGEDMEAIKDGTYDFSIPKENWHPVDPDFLALWEEKGVKDEEN